MWKETSMLYINPLFRDDKCSDYIGGDLPVKLGDLDNQSFAELSKQYNKTTIKHIFQFKELFASGFDRYLYYMYHAFSCSPSFDVFVTYYGSGKTIPKLAAEANVTKQAISSKIQMTYQKMEPFLLKFYKTCENELTVSSPIICLEELTEGLTQEQCTVVSSLLHSISSTNITFLPKLNLILRSSVYEEINEICKELCQSNVINKVLIETSIVEHKQINRIYKTYLVHTIIDDILTSEYKYTHMKNYYVRAKSLQVSIAEYIMKYNYLNGIKMTDEAYEEFKQKAYDMFGLQLISKRALNGNFTNSPNIININNSEFCHIDNIDFNHADIDAIIVYVHSYMSNHDSLSSSELYNTFKDRLTNTGITNAITLYSIIKSKVYDNYSFWRFTIYNKSAKSV